MATNGDAALAAGMDVVLGTEDIRKSFDEINKTRDYMALVPPSRGGTGSPTPAGARANLGITAANLPTLGVFGTGSSNGQADLEYLNGQISLAAATAASAAATAAAAQAAAANRVSRAGDSMSGDLYLPNASAATSGYTVAYIDGTGRISRGASTERVKKYITAIGPSVLGDIFPDVFRFQMRTGDGSWKFGWIAERLAESETLRPFVVWETEADGKTLALDPAGNPMPLSIDFISLLIVQVAQLNVRVTVLERALEA